MADLDPDKAHAASVFVPPGSKSEYVEAAGTLRPGFRRTVDSDDPHSKWTAQQAAFNDPAELPGQVFDPRQLPDPAVAIEAGFRPQVVPEHLIIERGEIHLQGPEPSEMAMLDAREEIRGAVLAHNTEQIAVQESNANSEAPKQEAPKQSAKSSAKSE